ncbi:MAG: hypothetical protein ACK6DZ_14660 [Acidobacteriota bacterium]
MMRVDRKSLLGGAHCFALHPFFVAWGWTKLYGLPRDPRLWAPFFLHDIGYIYCHKMDGDEGEKYVLLEAKIMNWLFGSKWGSECIRHSRDWCSRNDLPISRLCLADKLAFVLIPPWLYLPMARWTGELAEYRQRSRTGQPGYEDDTHDELADLNADDEVRWLRGLQSYTLRWVLAHRDEAV